MDIVVVPLQRGAAEGQGGKAKEEPLAVSGQHLSESVPESKEPGSGRVDAAAEMFKVGWPWTWATWPHPARTLGLLRVKAPV
jgi:hypothetical protein